MDRFLLTLAARWLHAKDAFTASCVCREWQTTMSGDRDGGDLWKQICKNTFPLSALASETEQDIDFRSLVLGLGRPMAPAPPRISFTSTLRVEDIVAIVELHRGHQVDGKRATEASWKIPVTEKHRDEGKIIETSNLNKRVKGLNAFSYSFAADGGRNEDIEHWESIHGGLRNVPYRPRSDYGNGESRPECFAYRDVLGGESRRQSQELLSVTRRQAPLQTRITLYRKDTSRSVCITDQPVCYDFFKGWIDEGVLVPFRAADERLQFATDDAGRTAQLMMANRGIVKIQVMGEFRLQLVQPPGEEAPWHANMRQALHAGRIYRSTIEDQADLSSIPYFEFEWRDLRFYLMGFFEGGAQQSIADPDVMVVLEGLCWK
jgi:hypothetical protein